ncbi:MAG: CubicO group peptidase (beta-lactamase class C family) [Limisphaerales bacterium]|jgi:CubicO group peptidase (beta-lactamase class C family)
MKKLILSLIGITAIVSTSLWWAGLSPTDLKANLQVGTGMGAKIACSAHYVSKLNRNQILEDLASYSPAIKLLDVTYDEARPGVSVSLLGMGTTTATYRPGLGCTMDIGDTTPLDRLTIPDLSLPDLGTSTLPWPAGPMVTTLSEPLQQSLQALLDQDNQLGFDTRALLVVHKGQVLGEVYAPGITPETPLLGWSMGKSFVSILLGNLSLRGNLNTAEQSLFEDWQGDDRREISIENLLRMSSGLEFAEVYAPGSDATHMLFNAYSAAAVAKEKPLAHPPGSHFSYSSGTTNLLSELWVSRMGGSQAAITSLSEEILAPLGMRGTVFEVDPSGVFVGSSYHYSTARDWARLGQLMLNKGSLNGHRLISQAWVEAATTPNSSTNEPRYGYQFWLNRGGETPRYDKLPSDAFSMQGNRAQVVMMIPSQDMVIVRLGWTSGKYPTNTNFSDILKTVTNS